MSGGYNDWPTGRGIFFSADKKFLVWINEEDHLRFISMQMGGNVAEVYKRLVKVKFMNKALCNTSPTSLNKLQRGITPARIGQLNGIQTLSMASHTKA